MPKKSALFVLFLTVFIDLVGFGIVIPLLTVYAEEKGASRFEISLPLTLFSLMQFLAAPIWGRWSDRVGRKPILVISLSTSALGYLIYALAPNFTWIVISRVVAGAGGANIAVAQAMIADVTPPEDRAKGMGLIGAAFGLGFVMGPALGAAASGLAGETAPAWVAFAICAGNAIAAIKVLPETRQKAQDAPRTAGSASPLEVIHGLRRALSLPELGRWIAVFWISTVAFAGLETSYGPFLKARLGYSMKNIYLVFVFIGVVIALVQGGLIRRLVPRFGEKRLAVAGAFLTGLGMALLAFTKGTATLLCFSALIAIGNGIRTPSVQSLISRGTPADEQGRILGASQGASSLARILGPLLGAGLFAYSGKNMGGDMKDGLVFVVGGALMILAMLLAMGGGKGRPSET